MEDRCLNGHRWLGLPGLLPESLPLSQLRADSRLDGWAPRDLNLHALSFEVPPEVWRELLRIEHLLDRIALRVLRRSVTRAPSTNLRGCLPLLGPVLGSASRRLTKRRGHGFWLTTETASTRAESADDGLWLTRLQMMGCGGVWWGVVIPDRASFRGSWPQTVRTGQGSDPRPSLDRGGGVGATRDVSSCCTGRREQSSYGPVKEVVLCDCVHCSTGAPRQLS
jgi:hypothetical protein